VRADDGQGAAAMTFHRANSYATWFGLDTDNEFKFGGWSAGAASYRFWTSANFNPAAYAPLTGAGFSGDITTYRAASPGTGVLFLGNSGARYVFYDGSNYVMPGSNLFVNGSQVMTTANAYDKATGARQDVNNIPSFNAAAIDIVRGGVLRARWTVDTGGTTILQNGDNGDNFFYVQSNGQVWTKQFGDLSTQIENRAYAWAATRQANLGFTPVQQSGGAYQQGNKIYIGWDGSQLRAQVDNLDLGPIHTNLTSTVIIDLRMTYAGDLSGAWSIVPTYGDPYGGGVVTGHCGTPSGTVQGLRYRYLQKRDGLGNWYTVSYA
jgi:hypothetical protein